MFVSLFQSALGCQCELQPDISQMLLVNVMSVAHGFSHVVFLAECSAPDVYHAPHC